MEPRIIHTRYSVCSCAGGAEVDEEDGDGRVGADAGDGGEVAQAREVGYRSVSEELPAPGVLL